MCEVKNQDYADDDDVFSNFRSSEMLGIEPELAILVRCLDKFKRIQAFIRVGSLAVKGEPVDDAIEDVINYMILLKGLIREGQCAAKELKPFPIDKFWWDVIKYRMENPSLRWGQVVFNTLWEGFPEVAADINTGPLDPFYNDDRVEPLIEHLRTVKI